MNKKYLRMLFKLLLKNHKSFIAYIYELKIHMIISFERK